MTVDEKIAVRGIFVLANARFDNRSIFQSGQSQSQTPPCLSQTFSSGNPIAGIGIERWSMTIDRQLNTATGKRRQAIDFFFKSDAGRELWRRE